jgi:hypothetical protein
MLNEKGSIRNSLRLQLRPSNLNLPAVCSINFLIFS